MSKRLYAKIVENGEIEIFEGKFVSLGGRTYFSPNNRIMKELGYKPLVVSPAPKLKDGDYLTVKHVDHGDRIEAEYSVSGGEI